MFFDCRVVEETNEKWVPESVVGGEKNLIDMLTDTEGFLFPLEEDVFSHLLIYFMKRSFQLPILGGRSKEYKGSFKTTLNRVKSTFWGSSFIFRLIGLQSAITQLLVLCVGKDFDAWLDQVGLVGNIVHLLI